MTNDEVKQFFIDNGAYCNFEIVNSPKFIHYDTIPDEKTGGFKLISSTQFIDTIIFIYFCILFIVSCETLFFNFNYKIVITFFLQLIR